MLHWFSAFAPELVWGLFTRSLGAVLFAAFVSLAIQIVSEAGRGGRLPVAPKLERIASDFPGWRRLAYFPTLLWISASDFALRTLAWGGSLAALVVVYGGPASPWALAFAYACLLSLDVAVGLIFPWECLLLEATVLALFLPATHPLPQLGALAPPSAAIAWAYRILLFRLMFGFGKQKFLGSTRHDLVYLKSFLLTQPLLSPVGWYAQKLPAWLLIPPLVFMFAVEIVAPFGALIPGPLSVLSALGSCLLMLGILLAGNFAYFSYLTIACSLVLLDNVTPLQLQLSSHVLTNAFVLLHTLAALCAFPFNSWLVHSWLQWSVWYRLPPGLQWPLQLLRAVHPSRWVHPYGVFPPNNTPSMKVSLLVEVSWDGSHWHELEFPHSPSHPHSRPQFVAPHHPRGDQSVLYEAFGLNSTSLVSSLVGPWDPYAYGAPPASALLSQRILEGHAARYLRGEVLKHHADPPTQVRLTTIMLQPASLREHTSSGAWWTRTPLAPHSPPRSDDPDFWNHLYPEPELWHFDAILWRRRCPSIQRLMQRAAAGDTDPFQLVASDGISHADLDRFWNELVPLVGERNRDFNYLPEVVSELRTRWDGPRRRALFRVLGRLSLILVARFEPLYLERAGQPLLAAKTYFQLWLLAEHLIAGGRETYRRAFSDPLSAHDALANLSPASGLFYLSVFRYESMLFEAQKLRLLAAVSPPYECAPPRPAANAGFERIANLVSGFYDIMPAIREAFQGPRYTHGIPERYPKFRQLRSGEIVVSARSAELDAVQPDAGLAR